MDVEKIKRIIERQPNLSTHLGMNFISTSDDDMCMATMKVDERNRQPFGFLSGGASLALAENLSVVAIQTSCENLVGCMFSSLNCFIAVVMKVSTSAF